MLKVGCHFSGIGSVNEAIKKFNLPMKVDYSIEYEPTTQRAYKEVFGTKNVFGDISQVEPRELPPVDVIITSPPCQAFSNAGSKKGLQDNRGLILFETFKIIEYQRPKMVLFENVENLKGIDNGKVLKIILNLFDLLGYRVKHKILNSLNYNSPQNRNRLFIVAFDKNEKINYKFPRKERLINKLKDICCENPSGVYYLDPHKTKRVRLKVGVRKYKYQNDGGNLVKSHHRIDTNYEQQQRIYKPFVSHTLQCGESNYFYFKKDTFRTLTIKERFRLQAFSNETIDKYLDLGLKKSDYLRFTGNTINVNVMGALLKTYCNCFNKFNDKRFNGENTFNVVFEYANHYIKNHYIKNYSKRDYKSENIRFKQSLAAKDTNKIRVSKTIELINRTIDTLKENKIPITKYQITKFSGLNKKTVSKYFDSCLS